LSHEDTTPSLSIDPGEKGKVLVNCFGGCDQDAVIGRLREMRLWPESDKSIQGDNGRVYLTEQDAISAAARGENVEHVYTYSDSFKIVRTDPKGFRPISRVAGGWQIGSPKKGNRPLYRLTEVRNTSGRVYVCEGEKAADMGRTLGLICATSAHGANGASGTDWTPLAGRDVVVLPDSDDEGKRYAAKVVDILESLDPPATVRILKLPGLPDNGDLVEYVGFDLHECMDSADIVRKIDTLANELKPTNSNGLPVPIPISQIVGSSGLSWIWYGYLAPCHATLLIGLWKSGKTTLVSWLLKLFGKGGYLAGHVNPARVLVVTEEGPRLWQERRDDMGLDDHIHLICKPFNGKPSKKTWHNFVVHLAGLVKSANYGVVVLDSFVNVSPIENENDNAEMQGICSEMNAITGAGAALLLIHHPAKGDGREGRASRGAGSLAAYVDIILEMRRYDPERQGGHQPTFPRYLTSSGHPIRMAARFNRQRPPSP
jgi:hypothetical protein